MRIPSIFLPAIMGVIAYILVSKLFPEKASDINSQKDLRGGDLVRNLLIQKIIKKIMNDRALRVAILTVFATAGANHFTHEVQELLADDALNQICVKEVNGQLKIVCDIIKENELNLHTKTMKELILRSNLSNENKINLLKIKLDFIINGACAGKKRFILASVIAALIAFWLSGVGGLALFLEALYRLFQEGKISRALYEQILEMVTKRGTKVPIEHLL
jgi:hypothetical protein